MSSKIEAIERLTALRDNGALTEEEFNQEKGKILSSSQYDAPRITTPSITSSADSHLFKNTNDIDEAKHLIQSSKTAIIMIMVGMFIDYVMFYYNEHVNSIAMPNSQVLTLLLIINAIYIAILFILHKRMSEKYSKFSSVLFFIFMSIDSITTIHDYEDAEIFVKWPMMAMTGAIIMLSVQSLRGTFAMNRLK